MRERALLSTAAAGLVCGLLLTVASTFAADEAQQLLQQGTSRLDAFVDQFRRTGDMTSGVGNLARAQAELEEARRQFERRGDWASAALSLIKLGQSKRMQAQWEQAIAYYKAAEVAARKAANQGHLAKALMDRAKAEMQTGNLSTAAELAEGAVQIAEGLRDDVLLFDALDVRAQILVAQGNLAAAADNLNRAFALREAIKDETLYYGYLDRAEVYQKIAEQCDYKRTYDVCLDAAERARLDYEQALKTARKLGWAGLAQMTQGFIDRLKMRRSLIESQRGSDEAVARSGVFAPKKPGDVLVTEEFITFDEKEIPQPLIAFYEENKAFERSAGGFGATLTARKFYVEGLMQQFQGSQDAALQSLLKAVELLESDRRALRDEQARGSFLEDKITFYYAPILQLLQRRRYAEAFELMERSRGRAMADLLATRELSVSRPAERALYAEAVRLRSAIGKKQAELFGLINRGAPRERLAEAETEIARLEASYRQLLARMAREAPQLSELTVAQPASLRALQEAMRRDKFEALEYLALEHALILWHISADSVHVLNVFLPRPELQKKVDALHASLSDANQRFDERTARELYLYLIQPAAKWIKSKRLVIVPHDRLHLVPFQVLADPASGRSLGEAFQLSYAPSATVLLGLKAVASPRGGQLLAVSDPDFETDQEVQAVAAFYANRNRVITDLPTEAEVKRLVGGYDVIHLSVHGEFDPGQPLLSHLRFAPGGGDDGNLTAAEMFGLPLDRSRLVVLSACESGKATAGQGSEVLGMVRGLIYSGAGTLVLSYWKVDAAATAVWMEAFHRVAQEQLPAEAARQALLAVKARPEYRQPYYWGAFMLISR